MSAMIENRAYSMARAPNNSMQLTALRAAADAARYMSPIAAVPMKLLTLLCLLTVCAVIGCSTSRAPQSSNDVVQDDVDGLVVEMHREQP